MIQSISIPADRVAELKQLSIEVESRKYIIQSMIQDKIDLNGEGFKMYQAEFQKFYADYDLAKTKLQADFIDGKISNPIRWDLDFTTNELKVEC